MPKPLPTTSTVTIKWTSPLGQAESVIQFADARKSGDAYMDLIQRAGELLDASRTTAK